jgi:CxxC motif-containing protein (DUF1111 family)
MAAPTGESLRLGNHEISGEMIDLVAAYVKRLRPPKMETSNGPGRDLFVAAGCAACHQPEMPSNDGGPVAAYTDLLLHDMGVDLDDGVGSPGVASAEWRTAPLIAMEQSPGRRYLHDGRASTLDGAIREHGGEAAKSRANYLALSAAERQALTDFVGSL